MKKWLLLLLVIVPAMLESFIYEIKVLRKWDAVCGKHHYFIGLSDFHDKSHRSTQCQADSLEQLLAQCDKNTTKIILEDLSSQDTPSCHHRFKVNSRGGILGGLATTCRAKGFDVENVEYRYCRVASLGPVLNHLNQPPHTFPSVATTRVASLAQEIDVIVQEIDHYRDGHGLDDAYKQSLQQVGSHLKQFKLDKHGHMTVADYLEQQTTPADRLEFLKHLLTFDSTLVDMRMIHTVLNAHDKNLVLALSGGAHITRVTDLLQTIGYELVYATNVQFRNEYDLHKCLGSTIIDGSYCIRPEPVGLEVIQQYI